MGFYLGLMSGTSMDAIDAALVLSVRPPKSTGRELFNLPWLNSKLGLFSRRPEDVQATLQQFTAATVAAAVHPDYVEAVAFAWLARRTLDGLTSSAGSVTGAEGARILGGVYRYA